MLQLLRKLRKTANQGLVLTTHQNQKSTRENENMMMHSHEKCTRYNRNADNFTVLKSHLFKNPVPRTDNTNPCAFSYGFAQPA